MRIKPLILLFILCFQILAPAGIWGNDVAKEYINNLNCAHENDSCFDEIVKEVKMACCDSAQNDEIECSNDANENDACCGDDCDCQCCHSIHISNIQFQISSLSKLGIYINEPNLLISFFYKNSFSKGFIGSLLNPPKFY